MDKQLAEQLVERLRSLDEPMGELMELVEQIPENERNPFQAGLGGVMRGLYADLMSPF